MQWTEIPHSGPAHLECHQFWQKRRLRSTLSGNHIVCVLVPWHISMCEVMQRACRRVQQDLIRSGSKCCCPPAMPDVQQDITKDVGAISTQEAHGCPEVLAQLELECVHGIQTDPKLEKSAFQNGAEENCQHTQPSLNKLQKSMGVGNAGAVDHVLQHSSKACCTKSRSASDTKGARGPHDHLQTYPSSQNNACAAPTCGRVGPGKQSVSKAMLNTTQALHGLAQDMEFQPAVLLASVIPNERSHEDAVAGQFKGFVDQLGKTRNAVVSHSAHGSAEASHAHRQSCKRQLLLDQHASCTKIKKRRDLKADIPREHVSGHVRMHHVDMHDQGCRPATDLAGSSYAYERWLQKDGGGMLCQPVYTSQDSALLLHPLIAAGTCGSGADGLELCHGTGADAAFSAVTPLPEARRVQAAWFAKTLEKAAVTRHAFMKESERLSAQQHHAMITMQESRNLNPSQRGRLEECDGELLYRSWLYSKSHTLNQ